MCIVPKMPTPQAPPPPPNKFDAMTSALKNMQARKAAIGGTTQSDTNVTMNSVTKVPTYTPAAGTSSILGG